MHRSAVLQQSAAVVHLSYWFEQLGAVELHIDDSQNPPQHWSPLMHD